VVRDLEIALWSRVLRRSLLARSAVLVGGPLVSVQSDKAGAIAGGAKPKKV
jgi:hypothetical protein